MWSYCVTQGTLIKVMWQSWMGGEFGGEWIHVSVRLSHFAVDLKYHNIVNRLDSNIKHKV